MAKDSGGQTDVGLSCLPVFLYSVWLLKMNPLNSRLVLAVAVIVGLATLLVIPASYTEAVAFSDVDPMVGRAKFHPFIDKIYDQQ